jgi:site-specific recombinase
MATARTSAWDLTALLNAADPKASRPERHLWLVRLLEWLRHAPVETTAPATLTAAAEPPREAPTPPAVLRLKHLLGVLERNHEHQQRVADLLRRIWAEVDSATLLADFGFAPRMHLWAELGRRLRSRVLPIDPATTDLGELFPLLFPHADDAAWLLALDSATLDRLRPYVAAMAPPAPPAPPADTPRAVAMAAAGARSPSGDVPPPRAHLVVPTPGREDVAWRAPFVEAIVFLANAVRASGFDPALRLRMSAELLAGQPFRQLARVAEKFGVHALGDDGLAPADSETALLQEAQYLRALLDACRRAADSVHEHLEAHGVSVDVVFEVDQLRERAHRLDALLTCIVSPAPGREIAALMAALVAASDERRSVRGLLAQHYSLLARQVAERSAETGEHYITRDRAAYRAMLLAAAGGGAVLGGTTLMKFAVMAIGLSAFWGGFWAGVNYATSFVVVQLLHFTVATKQPAMTAPAMAARLVDLGDDAQVEGFVDEVAHLIRSQAAGIFGNLALVTPIVLLAQAASRALLGAPLVGHTASLHVLESLTLLGPTPLYAAFTGGLLFASSLVAGWAENWFVWHRLAGAIAWNPRIVGRLGAARAARWSVYWRKNISGFAANVSLGFLLGVVPVVALFFGLPIEVRHVTLSTGQLAAAVGSEGFGLMREAPFWWCVAGVAVTAVLNVTVSFLLAFRVALRSRGIRLADRSRIYRAVRARLLRKPLSFVLPPPDPVPPAG